MMIRRPRLFQFSVILTLATLLLLGAHPSRAEDVKPRPPLTPPWALECWLWEDDDCTAARILELLDGYEKHDIPARTIIIDAPWATRYNDFRIDEKAYPNPAQFFADLEKRGIRTVLWMTPMVNSESNDTAIKDSKDWFEETKAKGYLAGAGHQQKWWHGLGGFIDYRNPEAMKWWRGMQQQVLDWGIDGWKLDDCALYFNSAVGRIVGTVGLPPAEERQGWMTTREYMDHFYRDEYQHGLARRGGDFITLARSIDGRIHPNGFSPMDAAPVTWVGDQKHTWTAKDEGLEEALNYILEAARVGYCVIGSDVGGYHGSMPIPANLYMRWAQFSAFCGLFLNGGHGERAMWKRTPQELEVVRKFAWLHNEMVPFMYTHVVDCHNGGLPLMRPIGKSGKRGEDLGGYHYMFGGDFLVAAIHEDALARTVTLPEGEWRYLFNDVDLIRGPATFAREYPMDEFPVYVREGSIVPLDVRRGYTGLGDRDCEGFITWNIYPGAGGAFTMHRTDGGGDTTVKVERGGAGGNENGIGISVTGAKGPHILRVHLEKAPTGVELDDAKIEAATGADVGWRYDESKHKLIIRTREYAGGRYRITP